MLHLNKTYYLMRMDRLVTMLHLREDVIFPQKGTSCNYGASKHSMISYENGPSCNHAASKERFIFLRMDSLVIMPHLEEDVIFPEIGPSCAYAASRESHIFPLILPHLKEDVIFP